VSFEKMDRIVAVHEDDMDVVVQPGLGWVELNQSLEEKGLFFPVDPAPGARIGGMVCLPSLFVAKEIVPGCDIRYADRAQSARYQCPAPEQTPTPTAPWPQTSSP